MAIRTIITHPHPVLRQKAEPVTVFDDELQTLIQDMAETMFDAPGVGLAANQIGVARQVVVVDRSTGDDERRYQALVNPVLSNGEGSVVDDEGCLSVRECYERVRRFRRILSAPKTNRATRWPSTPRTGSPASSSTRSII